MIAILVDERRLAAGLDSALTALVARTACEVMTPAVLLERITGVRVIGDSERRAVVRRIAATRDDVGLPAHVRASTSFASRVIAAIDETGERAPYEAVVEHYRTLLAFANVLDTPDALHRALAGERVSIRLPQLHIDTSLVADADRAFAWRRLCAAAGIAHEPLDLGPPALPAIDHGLVAGVGALLRVAAGIGESEIDAAVRDALVRRPAGIAPDDARLLIAAAGERGSVLAVIDAGTVAMSARARRDAAAFARGVRAVTAAYGAPDASASSTLAAIARAYALDHAPTAAALVRIARDFDRARTLGPQWDAAAFCAEIAAELAGTPRSGAVPAAPPKAARAPQAPDAPAAVAVRKMHFSASSLNAYAQCARKWYFRYVCAAVEDRGSSASIYGTAFHAALEDFHGIYSRFDDVDRETLASRLDACVGAAFERYRGRFDAPVEYELQRRRARRTAKRYLHWLLERARTAPFEVVGCEVMTELELDGHAFVGYIDRLDRDDHTGTIGVVDYKTGSIALSAAEYRAEVTAFREFQLPFYYWARTAAGDRVTRLALIPLKDALLDVAPIELEIVPGTASSPPARRDAQRGTIAVGELERARATMIEYAGRLAGGTIAHYPATDDAEACRYCAYIDACRERPIDRQERFGR